MAAVSASPLTGLRILVVEDDALIGLTLTNMLEDLGCVVAGRATDITEAVSASSEAEVDAAILDLDLNGVSAMPVVDILRDRHIPVILSSGYGDHAGAATGPTLLKPYDAKALERALHVVINGSA